MRITALEDIDVLWAVLFQFKTPHLTMHVRCVDAESIAYLALMSALASRRRAA